MQPTTPTETPSVPPQEQVTQIPTSPNEMPWALFSVNPHALRNILVTLNQFSAVEIHWENDNAESNRTGEPAGEWQVEIRTAHGKRIKGKHEDIENVLWYVTTLAEQAESEAWKKQDAVRAAALAKLTPEEQRVLRIAR